MALLPGYQSIYEGILASCRRRMKGWKTEPPSSCCNKSKYVREKGLDNMEIRLCPSLIFYKV